MLTVRIILFLLGTAAILFVSRSALRHPNSHGFYRFFAWECILILFTLNFPDWFAHPFTWHQIISWVLLCASIIPVVWGLLLLHKKGKPVTERSSEPALLGLEATTSLVTTGIYKYIRHPLYSSLLLLTWGIFFKVPSWAGFSLSLAASAFLQRTAWVEEHENLRYFGAAYASYIKKTKRFIPFLF